MDIGSTLPLADPMASALAGVQNARARADAAGQQLAAGNVDPAVVVDLVAAQTDFAVNAKVMQTSADATRRLLDVTV